MFQVIFWICFLGNFMAQCFLDNCVQPPLECPNENVTFWLYTRSNKDNPHQLRVKDPASVTSAPWVQEAPIKIIIHGYTGHKEYTPNDFIRPAYIECCDYNLISVDYEPLAREPCYVSAARNTQLVGKCSAQLIDVLVRDHGFNLSRFHVIGFSLGAQTAGFVGKNLNSGRLERITGLDPALPLFITQNSQRRLVSSDAKFVDVLHTDALERGKLEACGHIDFYANGGLTQPGCTDTVNRSKSSCDHARAPEYYAESINSPVGFYGTKCFSWISYMIGWCELVDSNEQVLYGEYISTNESGLYFFTTNSEPPYARGPNRRQARSTPSNLYNN